MFAELRRFLLVGAVAYLLDLAVFWWLYDASLVSVEFARLFAFAATTVLTYLLNGRYTFRVLLRDASLMRYVAVQMLGAVLNLSVFWLAIQPLLDIYPPVALTLGAFSGSALNFFAMRRYVF